MADIETGWQRGWQPHRTVVIITNDVANDEEQSNALFNDLLSRHRYITENVPKPTALSRGLGWLPFLFHQQIHDFIFWVRRSTKSLPLAQQVESGNTQQDEAGSSSSAVEVADPATIAKMATERFTTEGMMLVVASGREAASVARSIRRLAPQHTFVVQIQYPGCRLEDFDFVILPEHEYNHHLWLSRWLAKSSWRLARWWAKTPGENVYFTKGIMHQVKDESVRRAGNLCKNELMDIRAPLLVIYIGEPTENCPFSDGVIRQLSVDLLNVLRVCGSIRICYSTTASKKMSDILAHFFRHDADKVKTWNESGCQDRHASIRQMAHIQHVAHFHNANALIVTADSLTVLSEACSTTIPVYVVGSEFCRSWHAKLLQQLIDEGFVERFTGQEEIFQHKRNNGFNEAIKASVKVSLALAKKAGDAFPFGHTFTR